MTTANILRHTETFDANKLNHIIQNKDRYAKMIRPGQINEFDTVMLAKYLKKSRGGKINVKYQQHDNKGRFYADGSLSLQNMVREVRHTISKEYYIDVDIVNAHPVICEFLCKEKGFKHDNLTRYINNREECLKELGVDRDVGKQIFLSVLNGGSEDYKKLKTKTPFIENFKNEMQEIHKLFATTHEKEFQEHAETKRATGKSWNLEASFMNTFLCDIENKILMVMVEFFGNPTDCVLCFDGLMLRNNKNYDLKRCESFINGKLGITVHLKQKEMSDDVRCDEMVQYNDADTRFSRDFQDFMSDDTLTVDDLHFWLKNTIFFIYNKGSPFYLTKNEEYDSLLDHTVKCYNQVKKFTLLDCLNVDIVTPNKDFDADILKQYEELTAKKDIKAFLKKHGHKLNPLAYGGHLGSKGFMGVAMIKKGFITSYDRVDFYPYLKRKGQPNLTATFNLFTGFPYEDKNIITNINFENSKLYKHIRDELMNGDVDEFNHFLDSIADMIQCPAQIRGISHLFYTKQGMGKGLMAEWMARVIGQEHFISFVNTTAYFSNFNSEQSVKLLKVLEEVSDKGEAFHKHDRLKGDQTALNIRIEPKGMEPYFVRHCARYWYFTNNENALYIENDDRRHTMHRANNRYANNITYFGPLWEEIRSAKFCKASFEFFAERKYDVENVIKSYSNKYKKEQQISNMPNGIKFLKHIVESDYENIKEKRGFIGVKEFQQNYKEWCVENGCKYHAGSFKVQLKKLDLEPKRSQENGERVLRYNINENVLLEKFRTYLSDPNFYFDIPTVENTKHIKEFLTK